MISTFVYGNMKFQCKFIKQYLKSDFRIQCFETNLNYLRLFLAHKTGNYNDRENGWKFRYLGSLGLVAQTYY